MKAKLPEVDQWHVSHGCAMWRARDLESEVQNFDSTSTNIDIDPDGTNGMATPSDGTNAQAVLRAITYRLSSTPPRQLPQVAAQLAGQIWACKDLISSPLGSTKQGNEGSIIVNRFRTYLSTLLQDRTIEGRWAAVVLVKATIEAGGVEALSKSNAWVRSLLGMLKKPDPSTTRILAIITLTRVFILTWDYTNLIREITTPALPAFIGTCLSNAENQRCSGGELQAILEAFATLIPKHPTMFRTHESQVRSTLLRILSITSSTVGSEKYYTAEHRRSAQRLLVLLHNCAPKQGAPDKWNETLRATVTAAHTTCDRIFRSVIEDWQSTSGVQPSLAINALLQGEVEVDNDDAAGMTGWKGVYAGSERLVALLDLLSSQMETVTAGAVTIRIGLVLDLLTRLYSLRTPSAKLATVKPNQQISKDEREALFAILPGIHVAALELTRIILHRFGNSVASITQPLLAQITWLFQAEASYSGVRTSTYGALANILKLQGPTLGRGDVSDVESIVKACCQDLLPTAQVVSAAHGVVNGSSNQDGVLGQQASKTTSANVPATLRLAAEALLPICFSQIAPTYLPGRLRTLMERTAVLTQHKDALFASVLNLASNGSRSKTQPSLLPLLAMQYSQSAEVEALLRPRMPVIRTGRSGSGESEADEEEYEDERSAIVNGYEDTADGAHDDEEVTNGLPDPHQNISGTADHEDLYSASPKRHVRAVDPEVTHDKRKVMDNDDDSAHTAKRVRAALTPDALLPDAVGSGFEPDHSTAQSGIPDSLATARVTSQQRGLAPASISTEGAFAGYNAGDMVDIGSEGSDFEMPPLTMEQDTEDEDEEDEQDEDGGG
ncbi:hypothetical protein LTR01_007681 [Friedmanniomyces endolithicus]|nr:hypothetical protein LTR01_007681 [Friedmanniomyces endolithicus]KAK0826800.1 hypothetical protein LTR73_006134 [Friedmanniomyces endolithicus]